MRIDVLSLFPDYFSGPFEQSMIKHAREKGLLTIEQTDIRRFSQDRHQRVDDRPYGGGPGMILMAPPVVSAIRSVKRAESLVVYLSPQGERLNAETAKELARCSHLVLLCGHYEGVDERVLESEIDREISIGDYVLTSGCSAAIVLVDALVRFIPGVLGHEQAAQEDSFEREGIFDCPHYTRPEVFEGRRVPPVLLSGNHEEINTWRRTQAFDKTRRVRPDLIKEVKQ